MNFIHQIERLQKLNKLLKAENTGTPEELADKLCISRRQLYNHIEELKNIGLAIKYCKRQKTFYYVEGSGLYVDFSLQVIRKDEQMKIFGGSDKMYFTCKDAARPEHIFNPSLNRYT